MGWSRKLGDISKRQRKKNEERRLELIKMETLKMQRCKLQWFRYVQRMANSSNGNIHIGYKMPRKTEHKVYRLCHRGPRAKKKWCMTDCGMCQRQEMMENFVYVAPSPATY